MRWPKRRASSGPGSASTLMSLTTPDSQPGLSRFSVASARMRARCCSGDSGQWPAGRGGDAFLRRRQLRRRLGRLHQFRTRRVFGRWLRFGFSENMLADVGGELLRWPSCRCRRSASSCSRKPAGPTRQAAQPGSRARQFVHSSSTSPTEIRLSIGRLRAMRLRAYPTEIRRQFVCRSVACLP